MAHTAHKTLERLEEVEWSLDRIREAAAQVAALMRESSHTVFFTGSGISTSAGVPDFRGPDGVWTRVAQGKEAPAASVSMQEAIPTPTHMAMRALHQHGLLHFVISQNVDGLHRRSGIPHSAIAELHGNSNVEQCELCGKRYMRDFAFHSNRSHFTGRVCSATGCSGRLRDTIINFGENLPMVELANGFAHSEKASLHVALGTSLTVRPACDMPIATKDRGGKLVIVNLQRTPLDQMCDVRVHGRVDAFVQCLMECLQIPIPAFAVERRVALWTTPEGRLAVAGVDTDGSPQYLCSAVAVNGRRTQIEREQWADPLCTDFTVDTAAAPCEVALEFFGHYGEPELRLSLPANFTRGSWRITVLPGGAAWTAVADSDADAVTPSYEKGDRSATQLVSQPDAVEDRTGIDYTGWFAVTPLEYCVHCEAVALCDGATFDVAQPCQECGNVGENMQCLSCHEVHCGRHVKQHMLAHYEASKHAIVMGFADLSAWCYECQSYINTGNRKLRQVYSLMHQAKFGFPPRSGR